MIASFLVDMEYRKTHWSVSSPHEGLFRESLAEAVCQAEEGEGPFEVVKSGERKRVYRWNDCPCGGTLYLKVYVRGFWRHLLKYHPSEKEARAIMAAESVGIGVPHLVAFGKRIVFPRTAEGFLLSSSPSNTVTVGKRWAELLVGEGTCGKPDVARDLELLLPEIRKLHDNGVCHYDMNPGNVLFDRTANKFIFIDFHRSRPLGNAGIGGRARDLLKLYLCLRPWFPWDEWVIALEDYFQNDGGLKDETLRVWSMEENKLTKRRVDGVVRACLRTRGSFRKFTDNNMVVYYNTEFSPDNILRFVEAEACHEGWKTERYVPGSSPSARQVWINEVRSSAEGNEVEIPVALVVRRSWGRVVWSILIRDGRRVARYAVRNRLSLESFL